MHFKDAVGRRGCRPLRGLFRVLPLAVIFLLIPVASAAAAPLTVELAGSGSGQVIGANGLNCSNIAGNEATTCSVNAPPNTTTLTVTAGPGTNFTGWTLISGASAGGCTGTVSSCTTGNFFLQALTYRATFEVDADPPGVEIDPVMPPIAPCVAPTATTACFSGEVDPKSVTTTWWFEYRPVGGSTWTKAPLPEGSVNATGLVPVSTAVSGLEPNTDFEVKLVAKNPGGERESGIEVFSTLATAPVTNSGLPFGIGSTTVNLTGTVNPRNSAVTSCRFEVVPLAQFEADQFDGVTGAQRVGCLQLPGSGGIPVEVAARVAGLDPRSEYRYRLVAENTTGTGQGDAMIFHTYRLPPDEAGCPNQAFRVDPLPSAGLFDCRAYELVSSAEKNGADAMTSPLSTATHVDFRVAALPAVPGGGVAWMDKGTGPNPLPDNGSHNWYLSTREASTSGWRVKSLGVPGSAGLTTEVSVLAASADLSATVIRNRIIDLDAGSSTSGGFWWRDAAGARTQIMSAAADGVGNRFEVSADGGHLFITSQARLLAEDTTVSGAAQLYEWTSGGGLRLAGLDSAEDPTSPCGAAFADAGRRTVSGDGSRVIFLSPDPASTATPAACRYGGSGGNSYVSDLYIREDGNTINISQPLAGEPSYGASFAGMTPSGSFVFFVSESKLTSDDPASGSGAADLYRYDTVNERLERVSVAQPGAEVNAGVSQVGVSGNSLRDSALVAEDGRHAYFLARGQLIAGKGRTATENGSVTRNLYRWSEGEGLAYVANVRGGGYSSPSAASPVRNETSASPLSPIVAAVASDGSALVFNSVSRLSGYDNRGTQAFYRYEAATGQIDCVSCSPAGIPILGDVGQPGGAGRSPAFRTSYEGGAADRQIPWGQFGGFSADGKTVVFASADQLLPEARNVEGPQTGRFDATYNIYAWHEGRLSLISTGRSLNSDFLIGASASGSEVYFTTSSQLSPLDRDNAYDVYSATVGGRPPAPGSPPAPCAGLDCRGSVGPAPLLPLVGSVSFVGDGNVPEPSEGEKASVRVKRLRAVGFAARLRLRVPGAGRIVTRGPWQRPTRRAVPRAGRFSVRIVLRRSARRALVRRKRLRVPVRVSYRSRDGGSASKTISVTFKQPKVKRVKRKKGGR